MEAPAAPRIYCAGTVLLAPGREVQLPAAAARHVAAVLRMRAGDALTLFDGNGGEYTSTILRADRSGVEVSIQARRAIEREAPNPITLVQAVIGADNMDLIVRKAVELGAAAVVPVIAERSQGMADERAARRVAHWREIAIAACEQCGRNRIPAIADILPLAKWMTERGGQSAPTIMLVPGASASLATALRTTIPHALVVGPEGGFTSAEIASLTEVGTIAAHLGARVLRAETAAIAALAICDAIACDAA